jgi:hypothetical protein
MLTDESHASSFGDHPILADVKQQIAIVHKKKDMVHREGHELIALLHS